MDIQAQRKAQALQNICFPVEKINIGGGYGIMNMQSGNLISEVSQRYCLVKNEDIIKPFADKFGINNLSGLTSYGRNRFYVAKFFTGREFDFGNGIEKDIVKEQIVIQNSYNKTKSFSFLFGAFRSVCANGLYSGESIINYKKIHVGVIPIKEIVTEVFANYAKNSFESWTKFKKIPLTLESQMKLLEKFEAFEIKEDSYRSQKLNEDIRYTSKWLLNKEETIDNQRNGWGFYNQVNRAIAGNLRGTSQISQVINANKRLESYLLNTLN